MLIDIVEVRPIGGHRLYLRFEDGAEGEIDFADRLQFDGVFEALADPEYFAKVQVLPDARTIGWPNGVDLDPDVLYSWVTGQPLPNYGSSDRDGSSPTT
jgi:hypothetical protein